MIDLKKTELRKLHNLVKVCKNNKIKNTSELFGYIDITPDHACASDSYRYMRYSGKFCDVAMSVPSELITALKAINPAVAQIEGTTETVEARLPGGVRIEAHGSQEKLGNMMGRCRDIVMKEYGSKYMDIKPKQLLEYIKSLPNEAKGIEFDLGRFKGEAVPLNGWSERIGEFTPVDIRATEPLKIGFDKKYIKDYLEIAKKEPFVRFFFNSSKEMIYAKEITFSDGATIPEYILMPLDIFKNKEDK